MWLQGYSPLKSGSFQMHDVSKDDAVSQMVAEDLVRSHQELREMFEQVEAAKNEWEATMDCIPEMVFLSDESATVRRCNRSFADYLGKDFMDIIGCSWIHLLRERGIQADADSDSPQVLRDASGGRWFELKKHPYSARGRESASGYVITVSDITMQKLFAEKLEEKNLQILDTVRVLNEKNLELGEAYAALKATQSQILQQEKMASIGQLAAGVAHEINNPIGFITSNLNSLGKYVSRLTDFIHTQNNVILSLADPPLMAEIREKEKSLKLDYILDDIPKTIEESLDGADRVHKIVQSLKSFSRTDDGKRVMADINACVECAVNIVWNEIKYKATLKKDLGSIPPTACSPNQLNQVFMNFLINAVHAIEHEGTISVRTWQEEGYVWASVSDTGCGIPPDNITRIFEPFFTTKEVGKGTGLGLSIAYDVIKRHNGDIWVESEPGMGTTFTFRIPVLEAP
jgi:two-component system NtrC family sensor kinase